MREPAQPAGSALPPGPAGGDALAQGAPAITLPKGGGAIRGIGESFAANPATGTGALSVPIAVSPRIRFGPQLTLSYDSGAGNGPFGIGWGLGLPAIARRTDRGLPTYRDAEEFDVFALAGAEDLVPELEGDGAGAPVIREERRAAGGASYVVRRYRPRVEGAFARIERWTNEADPADVHWRSISRDNVLTLYGLDPSSRIADPDDPRRIFSWLMREARDDRGNAIVYEHRAEDGAGADLGRAHERNRGGADAPRRAAGRYLKRIRYGNRAPLLDAEGRRPALLRAEQRAGAGWMFEVVLDYGEHDDAAPAPQGGGQWAYRPDPFSTYRAGFELRTCRLCRRVLVFHHFPGEPGVGAGCLVRSTDLRYAHEDQPRGPDEPVYSLLAAVTQSGYVREGAGYRRRSLPPLELSYSRPAVQDRVEEVDAASLEHLPAGLDGAAYRWVDLHGEGLPGALTEQGGAWLYKRNLSPIGERPVELAPAELVAAMPSGGLAGGRAQMMDLAGDGRPDLVLLEGPAQGFFEHDGGEGWLPFRPFASQLARAPGDPSLRLVDLDGDGRADALVSEDDALVWHPSLGEAGFGPGRRVPLALDEERGPRLVFADPEQAIYLADMSGDGLADLARVRNGEVCYWPNLGYGRFGAKVTMDRAPWLDSPDQFEQRRVRLADIDGSGTADLIYLGRDGVRLCFNQSGNSWGAPRTLAAAPPVSDLASVMVADLRGSGTACLVWSSPLPGDAGRQLRYVSLMGDRKPHLLVGVANNLGAETRIAYASSVKFYLRDRRDGRPWLTRLPFPVHVVERVEARDRISGGQLVTRYAYHHGHYDGEEREFRGFGMVERWDAEELARPAAGEGAGIEVPPTLTRSWFHTGAHPGDGHVSDHFAWLGEYYREPALRHDDAEARRHLLPDTALPAGLTPAEEREACRALRGALLRQEVYGLDGEGAGEGPPGHPYSVVEQNLTVRRVQPRGPNRHAVFFAHPRETLSYHYERDPADPRVGHELTLEVDAYGNTLRSLAVAYGRRGPGADPGLTDEDRATQARALLTYTERRVTNAVLGADDYRAPLPAETLSYELTGFRPEGGAARFSLEELARGGFAALEGAEDSAYERAPDHSAPQRRLIARARTRYRADDLAALLPLGEIEPLALPGERYRLALTPGLLAQVYRRGGEGLLPDPAAVLGGSGPDGGGYVDMDGDGSWWAPSGRAFLSPDAADSPAQERAHARRHFFLPRRYVDPFAQATAVAYDAYDLLPLETRDPLGNLVSAGERRADGSLDPGRPGHDYRVLQPRLVSDPNRNRTMVAFDALGMVAATATAGKPGEQAGDLLEGFASDPELAELQAFVADPRARAAGLLGQATARIVYDLGRYRRTGQPALVATLARETHLHDPGGDAPRIQVSFAYADGLGRELQRKVMAEPGVAPRRAPAAALPGGDVGPGALARDAAGRPVEAHAPRRWAASGRTVYTSKGAPARQYEPFFSATHLYEPEPELTDTGVSRTLVYDPAGRVVATLHPSHSYEKLVLGPWRQASWDVNDTVLGDPRDDPDIGALTAGQVAALAAEEGGPWQTWHQRREGGALGPREQAAAAKAAAHADTPTAAHLDPLGRPFLTLAHGGLDAGGAPVLLATRVALDLQGRPLAVRDALGREVMRYSYDMLGGRIRQDSMDAGPRWALGDVLGRPIRAWDGRGHSFRHTYDQLRRPAGSFVRGGAAGDREICYALTEYGEALGGAEGANLRGRVLRQRDGAGVVTALWRNPATGRDEAYDFRGNPLHSTRQLAASYKAAPDWSGPVELEPEAYTSHTSYDALGRPTALVTPHTPAMAPSTIRPGYSEAGLLERVEASLRGAAAPTPFVAGIAYNARGQRTQIAYAARDGRLISTRYGYDPETFRLVHLYTRRGVDPDTGQGGAFAEDCANPRPPPATTAAPDPPPAGGACGLLNLRYTYDPAGNIVQIADEAHQPTYFRNRRVAPGADYTYDPLYRLALAVGREHLGQAGGQRHAPTPPGALGGPHARLPHPGDGDAMGVYAEAYLYDAVGNLLELIHQAESGGWRRGYAYAEASPLDPAATSNRLSGTAIGDGPLEPHSYDEHGNTTGMPHLPLMRWDHLDRLQATARQVVGDGGAPETTYYVYDAGGQRVRKVTEGRAAAGRAPARRAERIYLGGLELYREYGAGGALSLERETLHLTDDRQRVALVETRTVGDDPAPARLVRYQLGDHLGSAALELDDEARVISYEEHYPFGATSYQAMRSQAEAPKRYRFTGKERDEESGLAYHGARYYAPWLGRWTAPDALFAPGRSNGFIYVANRPVVLRDPSGLAGKPPDFTDQEIDEALEKMDPGKPQRLPLRADVDERDAVKGGKAGGVNGSPTAPENKWLTDWKTNQDTKSNRVMSAPKTNIEPFEVPPADAPLAERRRAGEKIIVGELDKPDELREFFEDAEERQKDKTRKTNQKGRKAIREGKLARTAASLEAAGMDPKTLTMQSPPDAPQFPKGDSVQLSPKDAPLDPKTGLVARAKAAIADAASSDTVKKIASSKATRVVVAVAPILLGGAAKATPFVGAAADAYDVANELEQGNTRRAILAGIGASEVPGASQAASIGLAVEDSAWTAKEIIDPEQKAEGWYYRNVQERLDRWF